MTLTSGMFFTIAMSFCWNKLHNRIQKYNPVKQSSNLQNDCYKLNYSSSSHHQTACFKATEGLHPHSCMALR
jgi:hypothetical protein